MIIISVVLRKNNMTLTNLVTDLRNAMASQALTEDEVWEIASRRIALPDNFGWHNNSGEIELKNMNFGRENSLLYHLLISGFPVKTMDEVQPMLDDFFTSARKTRLKSGTAKVSYSVLWTPEAFQAERKLNNLFSDEIRVEARAYTCDPTRVRIGMNEQSHELEAKMKANLMTLAATGKYRLKLGELVDEIGPNLARVVLSKSDAQRVIRAAERNQIGKYFKSIVEKQLQPQKRTSLTLSLYGGIGIKEKEIIEAVIPAAQLDGLEQILGRSLVNCSESESRVTEFMKLYGIIGLVKGRRLTDLQTIAKRIPQMDLGLIYNHPMLTNGEAKELLEQEIAIISEGYDSILGLGLNSHMWRGGIVKRLASEHFGENVLRGFDELSTDDYVAFLKSQGYAEPTAKNVFEDYIRRSRERAREKSAEDKEYQEKWEMMMRKDFNGEGKRAFDTEPDYIAKERHLLEFFRQSYARNPRNSVARFSEFYQHTPPRLTIYADANNKDVLSLPRLKLPEKSRLYSFGIIEHMNGKYSNDLRISRTLPSTDRIHFWSRTSIDNPTLLSLQEEACKRMGIHFV